MWQIKSGRSTAAEIPPAPSFNPNGGSATLFDPNMVEAVDRQTALKVELHERLLDSINLAALETMSRGEIEAEMGDLVQELLAEQRYALNAAERKQLTADLLDELLGLGPLEPLLKDPTITDILVNTHRHVFVERRGRLEETTARFKDERHLLRIIARIVSAVGRRVDES